MHFKSIPKRKYVLLIGDLSIILFSTLVGFLFRIGKPINFPNVHTGATLIITFVYPIIFYIGDLYNIEQKFKSLKSVSKIILSTSIGAIVISSIFYALPNYRYGRGIFLIQTGILILLICLWRFLFNAYFKATVKPRHVLLTSKDWASEILYSVLRRNPEYKVVGILNGDTPLTGNPYPTSLPVFQLQEVEEVKKKSEIDGIVIDTMEEKSEHYWKALLKYKMSGIDIIDASSLYQELTGKIPVHSVNDEWFVHSPGYALLISSFAQRVKRLFDVGISFLALIIIWPLIGLIALAIRIDSPGPVFYRQKRVGKGEREFELIKFRTMIDNAEKGRGAVWAQKNDSRVTQVGKVLRLSRLDELPQLINVLKEEMSFIGPRPERPEFVKGLEEKIPYYSLRHSVKPGITGWAQVNYRYGASVEDAIEKLQYDLFYIQNMSLLLEIRILLKTIQVVLFGKGSR